MPNPNQLNTHNESNRHEMPVFSYPNNEIISENPDKKVERKQSSQMADLEDFNDFVNSNSLKIEKFDSQIKLSNYIYNNFYKNKQSDERMLLDSWYSWESLDEHNNAMSHLTERNATQRENDTWRGIQVGEVEPNKFGRIYLNPKNENYASSYRQIVETLADKGASFRIKFLKHMDQNDFNRSDKIVVYFNPEQFELVKDTLVDWVEKHPQKMNTNTPRFTEKLTNSEGEVLNGISFAESPSMGTSFGTRMSSILAECYKETTNKNGQFDINNDDFFDTFAKSCIEKGVDINHLYKNINTNFPTI